MTVGDLIEELGKHPRWAPVRVLTSHCWAGVPEGEPTPIELSPEDALEADVVIFEGNHVLIESK